MNYTETELPYPDTAALDYSSRGRPTVAQRTKGLLSDGYSDHEVWEILCREYPMSTDPGYVAWYRNGMMHGFSQEPA